MVLAKTNISGEKTTVVLQVREALTLPQEWPGQGRTGQQQSSATLHNIPAQQLELAHQKCLKLFGLTAALQGIFKGLQRNI